ncbi:hypothetical protein ACFIOY_15590 [Bradyrhizobium sp. TZ2]
MIAALNLIRIFQPFLTGDIGAPSYSRAASLAQSQEAPIAEPSANFPAAPVLIPLLIVISYLLVFASHIARSRLKGVGVDFSAILTI